MEIYHTETKANNDGLLAELKAKGIEWANGTEITAEITAEIKNWETYESRTCVRVAGTLAFYDEKDYYTSAYPNVQIIKYEAKGCAEVQYVIEFGEYFYKKTRNVREGTRNIIVTSKVKDANWFSCKENAIEVSKLVGGVVKELTTRVTEVRE